MPSNETTRRQVLTAGGLVAAATLGGCSQVLPGRSDDDRRLVLTLSPLDGPLRERYVENLTETQNPSDEAAFDAAVTGEEYTTQGRPPFFARSDDEPTYARRNGTYYRLDSLVVGERTVEHPVLRLYEVEGENAPDGVPQSSLPKADRRAVRVAYFAARARGNPGGVPWDLVEHGGYVYHDEEAIAASELLAESGPSHVAYRNAVYEVRVARETFHEAVYRPDVDPVADTDAELEAILRASLLDARVARADLSGAEREVLGQATRDRYAESHPYSDAFASVLERLGERAYVDGDVQKDAGELSARGLQYLLYDGRYYRFVLRFVTGR